MTGVVPALISNDNLCVLREEIGDLALTLVSPLEADEADPRHV
jgi:hypothetical protein